MSSFERYTKYENEILSETNYIKKSFDMYFELSNSQTKFRNSYNTGPFFFGLTCNALLEVSITRLSKLYEKDPQVISIFKYLEFVEQNAQTICEEKKTFLRQIAINNKRKLNDDFSSRLCQLKKVRDNYLAHNNMRYFANDDIWKDAGLLISDYRILIDLPYTIINDFTVLLRNVNSGKGTAGGESDIKEIMTLLEMGREARRSSRK